MNTATLHIKNMVCQRCIIAVENILRDEEIAFQSVSIGEIQLSELLNKEKRDRIIEKMSVIGLEIIENHTSGLVEKIKYLVMKRVRNEVPEMDKKIKLSNYLSEEVNHEYTYISSLFSSVEGRTIENYQIAQRIEKAKELLTYGQLTLSQIAFELEYSSVAHLSNQFKKIAYVTPTYYKEHNISNRLSIDKI
jgi:AraC family transcriptional regulator